MGIPPTAEATTGFFFQSASETVSPNPSRKLFWSTMVDARCRAFTSSGAHAGSSSTLMSGSPSASRKTSFNTTAPSGSSEALPPEFRRRKHGAVIFRNKLLEKIPDRSVRVRQVDVAAPHPMICSRPARLNQRRRLRVVDDHEFGIQRQLLAIHLVVGEKNIEVSLTGMV